MFRSFVLLVCVGALLLAVGCIPLSVHQPYLEEDILFNSDLVGKWSESNGHKQFEFSQLDEKSYAVKMIEGENRSSNFVAHLFKIEGQLYLDLYPEKSTAEDDLEFHDGHLLPLHSFYRVEQLSPTLIIGALDVEWIASKLRKEPELVAHIWLSQHELLFTGEPEKVRNFLAKFGTAEGIQAETNEYIKK